MVRTSLALLIVVLMLALAAPLALGTGGPVDTPGPWAALNGPAVPHREAAPEISFIASPSPTCYRPAQRTGSCYIQWSYLYVSASSPQYLVTMTVTIDGRLRANHAGFFQGAMYVPGGMYGPGFEVACGLPGASGVPAMGRTYSYAIRARETGGAGAANYGSVTCPADGISLFVPLIAKE